MKFGYISPVFLDGNGSITLTASQLGKLGVDQDVVSDWETFWAENGEEFPGDFDVNDAAGMLAKYGFKLADPDTWYNPLF
jgi:hypothetical protein